MKSRLWIYTCSAMIMALLSPPAGADDLPVLWQAPAGVTVDTCPAIDSNGVVYVTCSGSPKYSDISGGKLFAFETNGSQKWFFPTAVDIHSSPAIGADGTIYFGCRDR